MTTIEIALHTMKLSNTAVRKLLRDTGVQHSVYFDSHTLKIVVNNDQLAALLPALIKQGLMT